METYHSIKAGRIYDFIASLSVAINFDLYRKELDKYNISMDRDLEGPIEEILALISDDIKGYRFFFSSILQDELDFNIGDSLLYLEEIWKSHSLDDYLDRIRAIDEDEIKKAIITFIDSLKEDSKQIKDKERLKVLLEDLDEFYDYLSSQPLSGETKWNIFTFIKDLDGYKDKYLDLMKKYSSIYESQIVGRSEAIEEYLSRFDVEMEEKGIEAFIPADQFVDKDNVEKLYIIPSFFHAYNIRHRVIKSTGENYIVIGRNMDKVLGLANREDMAEKATAVFKNLGDPTRYKFIKLLSQGEKYGQEIADELNITSPTVSYHANNLLMADLTTIKRHENKTYYTLNKATLLETIDFIRKDLNL